MQALSRDKNRGGNMKRLVASGLAFAIASCSGQKSKSDDSREFGSIKVSPNTNGALNSGDVDVQADDSVIIAQGVPSSELDKVGQGLPTTESGTSIAVPGAKAPNPPSGDAGTGKAATPNAQDLPADLKAKLTKCYAQWDKVIWNKNALVDIREVSIQVDKLKSSNIHLAGATVEIVFVDIKASNEVEKVKLSMENKSALYCVDIQAKKEIEQVDISNICGAKVGVLQLDTAKAKKVNITEFCPKP